MSTFAKTLMNQARTVMFRKDVQNGIRYLKSGEKILDAWRNAAAIGGTASYVLAASSALGILLEELGNVDETATYDLMQGMGYKQVRIGVTKFVYDFLTRSPLPFRKVSLSDHSYLHLWDVGIGAVLYGNDDPDLESMWVLNDLDFGEVLRKLVWDQHHSYSVSASGRNYNPTFKLTEMGDPGQYLGEPEVDRVCERLRRYNSFRCVLIVGPTGAGKSTLARKIGMELYPGARTLKVTTSVMKNVEDRTLVDLINLLQPSVLLMDDIQTLIANEDVMLPLMESMHERNNGHSIVIGTYMASDMRKIIGQDGRIIPGSLYKPGMRPGRIDEVIVIPPPDESHRRQILSLYLGEEPPEEMVLLTQGMTGAYLQELAIRVKSHGIDGWMEEAEALRCALPPESLDDDDEDMDEGDFMSLPGN